MTNSFIIVFYISYWVLIWKTRLVPQGCFLPLPFYNSVMEQEEKVSFSSVSFICWLVCAFVCDWFSLFVQNHFQEGRHVDPEDGVKVVQNINRLKTPDKAMTSRWPINSAGRIFCMLSYTHHAWPKIQRWDHMTTSSYLLTFTYEFILYWWLSKIPRQRFASWYKGRWPCSTGVLLGLLLDKLANTVYDSKFLVLGATIRVETKAITRNKVELNNNVNIARIAMLSRSLSDCKSLTPNAMIQVSQFVCNSQLCHYVTKSLNRSQSKSKSLSI